MASFVLIPRQPDGQSGAQPSTPVFDGHSSHQGSVRLGRAEELGLLGDRSFTIEANIFIRKWNVHNQGDNALVAINDYGPGTFHWVIRHGRLWAAFYGPPSIHSGQNLELNRWHHVAVIYRVEEGGEEGQHRCHLSLYCDGVITGTVTENRLPPLSNCTLRLGEYAHGRPLNGLATNVRLWNTALDQRQLATLQRANEFGTVVPGAPGLVEEQALVLSWENIAQRFWWKQTVAYGGWSRNLHPYCSPVLQARVEAALHHNRILPPELMLRILQYLPLE